MYDLQHEVGINKVVEALDKDSQESKAGEQPRKGGNYPMNRLLVTTPTKPEKTKGEQYAADHDRW